MNSATKLKIYSKLVSAKKAIDKASIAVGTVGVTALGLATSASAEGAVTPAVTPVVDFSGVDLTGLTSSITGCIPQVLPVAVTMVGIRKAISFFLGTIRGC